MYFYNFLCLAPKLEIFHVLGMKLFLISASNMDSPKACGPPPSEATYADLTTAAASISEHAKSNGYALFKRSSKQRRVIYACDQAGKPQARAKNPNIHESKRREGSCSKKCDCQMKVALKLDQITQQWELEVIEGSYNHNASADPSAHPAYRIAALDSRIVTEIESLTLSGLNNSQILAVICRSNPSVLLAQKDMSNLVQKTRL
jgi:hypothetical protein